MPIQVKLQPHNGKFEGELEIRSIECDLSSALVNVCITTMHHDTRSKAKTATKQIIREVINRLQKELNR